MTFDGLDKNYYGAILADPPWRFQVWGDQTNSSATHAYDHYPTMDGDAILNLPVDTLAADDCVLFLWFSWPFLDLAMHLIDNWGFKYKTCAFCWIKADNTKPDLFSDALPVSIGAGYWTRANSEACLLATRGKPKRRDAGVRQAIIEPRREHSRKPDCVHERIERLVAGPYLELFARKSRPGWTTWGNETTKFDKGTLDITCNAG